MLYTVSQAYAYLNRAIGKDAIRAKMQSGEIPSLFDGKKYITTKTHLDKYINKKNAEMEIAARKLKKTS